MISLNEIIQNRRLVLGRNERYLKYIRPYNLSRAIAIADDKVVSKRILEKNNIPVPKKIALIKNYNDLKNFDFSTLPKSFVIKPVHGVRGGGVEIVYNKDKEGRWIRADGSRLSERALKAYAQDVIDGKYSLFNEPDRVLIEERVRPHKNFKYYTFRGTPDIRIIVFNKVPIMSYVRLPTRESNGKANLDLGAIGAGIDMAVGKTTTAIIGKSKEIDMVPGKNLVLSGLKIPYWDRILRYAIEASKATGLGFAAIDFLIDQDKGPLIVELNARPGLSIQLANDDGLRWRLRKARGLKVKSTEQGIRLAKDLFGGEIEEEIETISGKQVIGLIENITIYSKDKKINETLKAKVDTGADLSSIDKTLAIKLGYGDVIEEFDKIYAELPKPVTSENDGLKIAQEIFDKLKDNYEFLTSVKYIKSSHGASLRPYIKMTAQMDSQDFETNFTIYNRETLSYSILLGKNTLNKFLIDPSKTTIS